MAIRFEFWMFKKYLICTVFPVLIRLVQNWFFFLVIKICFSTYIRAACDLHNLYLYESFFWAKTIWPPRSSYTLKHFISIDAMYFRKNLWFVIFESNYSSCSEFLFRFTTKIIFPLYETKHVLIKESLFIVWK